MLTTIWTPGLIAGLAFISVASGQRPATSLEFPFQVSIQNATNKAHLCGGVIITSKWILTVRDCAQKSTSLLVGYGSSDSNQPTATTTNRRIIFDNEYKVKINPLALIELENEIIFTDTAKQVRLPTKNADYQMSKAKISGWKVDSVMHKHPTLNVIDNYRVVFRDCSRPGGIPVPLNSDQFCGFDEEFPEYFSLFDLGTTISKNGIMIGVLPKTPDNVVSPIIFVKVSEYDEWIKNILGEESEKLSWVDTIPKDSAETKKASALVVCLIFIYLARLI